VGFAIPSNQARYVATQLIQSRKVARPWLGITGFPVNPELSEGLGLGIQQGILVVEVVRGSPAAQAGLHGGDREVIYRGVRLPVGGDVLARVNEQEVLDMKQLGRLLNKLRVGQTVTLSVYRNGRPMELEVLLAERP